MEHIYFPYYSGKIKFTKCQGLIDLDTFISKQKNPTQKIKDILSEISTLNSIEDKPKKRALKHKLFSFTPSVVIKPGAKRCYDNVVEYTGLMQLDFDKIETIELAIELKQFLFDSYSFVVCSYLSPSKLGVKCLIRITKPKSKEHYKAIHKAVTEEFGGIAYFDEATKNAMLPLFLSYDENILYRPTTTSNLFDKEDWSKPEYVKLNDKQKTSYSFDNDNKLSITTVNIFTNKMNRIIDNGHTQLRSACLILGSRSGAGYISINDAEKLAIDLVLTNSYLQKDLENYKSTAIWAINQGFKNPKYY